MNIGIIGLGLIGGSLGRTIVKNTNHKVFGQDVSDDAMRKGVMLNAYSEALDDSNINVMDMIIIALNPGVTEEVLYNIVPKLKNGCMIIDCAGNKRQIVGTMHELEKVYPELFFVGGHPMAGKEFSGIRYSSASLFANASMIITPVTMDIICLSKIKAFFLELGFGNVEMTNEINHDRMIAFTSQLAHVVSSCYVLNPNAEKHSGYSAGSFKDMTRVAKLNPDMWVELLIGNRDNVVSEINSFIDTLTKYRDAINLSNTVDLKELLQCGNDIKITIDKMSK